MSVLIYVVFVADENVLCVVIIEKNFLPENGRFDVHRRLEKRAILSPANAEGTSSDTERKEVKRRFVFVVCTLKGK